MKVNHLNVLIIALSFNSCLNPGYKLEKNNDGEPIIDIEAYTLNNKPTLEDFNVIDTASYYIELFDGLDSNEDQRANPTILKFHKDGFFKNDSYLYFGKFDKKRHKNSAYYGGKYAIDGNRITMEAFYPSSGGKTKRFSKVIHKGFIEKGIITINFFNTTHKYARRTYSQIFK